MKTEEGKQKRVELGETEINLDYENNLNEELPKVTGQGEPNLDSGYAWVILIVMFLLNSTTAGTSRVYGLIYARQISAQYYDHEEASWPIATASTVENLAGVLTPALAQVLSWRQIQLLSTSLFILSNLGAYYSDSLFIDILCLGVIQGLALSSNTVLLLAINNDYFERFRTTAFGIAMSGATCGVLFLCPAVNLILASEPNIFRPAYLFIAIVLVLNLFLSLFIKPRAETHSYKLWIEEKERRVLEEIEEKARNKRKEEIELNQAKQLGEQNAQNNLLTVLRRNSTLLERKCSIASVNLSIQTGPRALHGSVRERISRKSFKEVNLPTKLPSQIAQECKQNQLSDEILNKSATNQLNLNLNKVDNNNDKRLNSVCSVSYSIFELDSNDYESETGQEQEKLFTFVDSLKLLSSPYLHCVWIMLTIYYLVSRIFIIILADFGTDHGLSGSQSYQLLNYWSFGELLGRVVLATLIDLRWISVKNCIVLVCTLVANTISCMVFFEGFYIYAFCSTTTAALASLEYMLINSLMVEYLGKNKALGCYSVAALISSVVLFGRPTLIGLFRDQMGSYDGLLLLLALICLSYGLLFWLLEPLFIRRWPKWVQNKAFLINNK